jgi:hypothetical protein
MVRAAVVALILAGLLAALWIAELRAREHGWTWACQNNLQCLQVALYVYAQDYDGRLPLRPAEGDFVAVRWPVHLHGKFLPEQPGPIFPYIKNAGLFGCPGGWRHFRDGSAPPAYEWNLDLSGKRLDDVADLPLLWCGGPWHRKGLTGPAGRNVVLVKGTPHWMDEDEFQAMRRSK